MASHEDDAAYVEFVDASRGTLLAYAWLLTGDGHAAEDMVQETFVRVYVRWRRLAGGQPLAYARRVLTTCTPTAGAPAGARCSPTRCRRRPTRPTR